MNTLLVSIPFVEGTPTLLLQVSPSIGSEAAVCAHGGVLSILKKAGLDLLAYKPVVPDCGLKECLMGLSDDSQTENVVFELKHHEEIRRVLIRHRQDLMGRGTSIPQSALAALRWDSGAMQ